HQDDVAHDHGQNQLFQAHRYLLRLKLWAEEIRKANASPERRLWPQPNTNRSGVRLFLPAAR
ncbi:MAG: hypothetical protein ACRD37_04970, partial [Candidatus Acidiferrales bacterium]